MVFVLLALSPLPLASARPAWQWLWVTLVGLVFLALVVKNRRRHVYADLPPALSVCFAIMLMFVGWGFAQALIPFSAGPDMHLPSIDAQWNALATFSVSPSRTLAVSTFFLSHTVFAFIVFRIFDRRERGVQLVRFCVIVGLFYAAYSFAVFVSGNKFVLWYEKWAYSNSLTGTFVNRNSFAAYAGLTLQSLLAYTFFWAQAELSENRKGREQYRHLLETVLQKAWWLPIGFFVIATSLILTNSRAGFVSTASAIVVFFVISPNRYQRKSSWQRSLASYSVFFSMLAGLFYLSGEMLDTRLQGDVSVDGRLANYPYIISAIQDRPLTGFGLGSFDNVHQTYRNEDDRDWFSRAHSDYLELAHSAGIPAAVWLLIGLLIAVVFLCRRLKYGSKYRPMIALGITSSLQLVLHSAVDFSMQIPAVSYLWVAILTSSIAIAHRCKISQDR